MFFIQNALLCTAQTSIFQKIFVKHFRIFAILHSYSQNFVYFSFLKRNTTERGEVGEVFSQKLISWVFNDQPCECAYVALMAVFRRQGERAWEKKLLRKWLRRFLSVKSLIGRFYWEETGDRRVIADPAARIRFYLHKEFRAAEIWFSLHKECPAAESWFSLHTLFFGAFVRFCKWKKASIYWIT